LNPAGLLACSDQHQNCDGGLISTHHDEGSMEDPEALEI